MHFCNPFQQFDQLGQAVDEVIDARPRGGALTVAYNNHESSVSIIGRRTLSDPLQHPRETLLAIVPLHGCAAGPGE